MSGSLVDISPLGLSVRSRLVTSISSELVQAYGGDVQEAGSAIAESFGLDGQWCEVGGELHTIGSGDVEIRLRLRPDAASWEADYFDASWSEGRYACVPPDRRVTVAVYVDRMQELAEELVQESDLRAAAAEGGVPGGRSSGATPRRCSGRAVHSAGQPPLRVDHLFRNTAGLGVGARTRRGGEPEHRS